MSGSRARRLAWCLASLAIASWFAGAAMLLQDADLETPDLLIGALTLTFAAVGAMVASRQPENRIGWLFVGVALSSGVAAFIHHLVDDGVRDGGEVGTLLGIGAAYSDVSWVPFMLVPATVLLLLFPDGRLPSARWRPVARCAVAGIVGTFATGLVNAGGLADFPTVENPLAVEHPAVDGLEGLSALLMLIGLVGSAASLVARYRAATYAERQQIKWLAAAGSVIALTIPVMVVLYDVVGSTVADATMMLSVLGLPLATGVAILRHRLYDVDLVINRTLVYGVLTVTLAGAYIGLVLLLQLVLSPSSDVAIAASTLAVAGLVRPARSRIQGGVDRRFYRRKYDAQRVLEDFSVRLREHVALESLEGELRDAIGRSVEPVHVSVWMARR